MFPNINLLPEYERQSSLLFIIFIIGLIVCLVLYGVLGFFYFTGKNKLNDVESELTELNEQKALLEGQLAALQIEEEDAYSLAAAYAKHLIVPTSALIDELFELLPNHGSLTTYRYDYQSVNIDTQFDSLSDAATYFNELNESQFVRSVKVHYLNAFDLELNERDEETVEDYNALPRYDVNYTIDLNQSFMQEVGARNE